MRLFIHACPALLSIAVYGCGGDSKAGMDPVNAQPPAAGGSVAAAGSGPAAGAGTSSGAGAGASAAGSRSAAGTGAPAAGSGGRAGAPAAGTAGSVAGAGAGGASGAPAAAGGGAGAGPMAGNGGAAGGAGPALGEMDTLVPHASWDCGMPAGIPAPKSGELAFEAKLTLGEVHDLKTTQFGDRLLIEVKGGTLEGPDIQATFMDRGIDWQLTLPNGALEIEQVNILRTSDGSNIYFRNCGTAPSADGEVRIVPDFEAPSSGRYNWLNTTKLVGTRVFDRAAKTMTMTVYKLPATAAATGNMVRVENPAGLPDQSWECAKPMGRQGAVLYMESVGIGSSVSVGNSKRGSRNIIPITGGTADGKLAGGVLSGGADFQLSAGGQFILDARYTLKTKDDELIIVRNCGPIGALVPVFETRKDGPYAYVNENKYLSSDPGISVGAVNLTIYETN